MGIYRIAVEGGKEGRYCMDGWESRMWMEVKSENFHKFVRVK
jgi:hypothetical protein